MLKKTIFFSVMVFTLAFSNTAEDASSPLIGKEVTGVNLQQLEYKQISNTNELLKNQKIESTNMEIVGDSIKKQRQRIKVVQSDELQLQSEIIKGKKTGIFSFLFN